MKTLVLILCFIVLLGYGGVGCSKLQAPVFVSTRDSSVPAGGMVARFSNQSSGRVTIIAHFRHYPANHFDVVVDLGPNEVKEIGWYEGWKVCSGDTITVSGQGYMDKTWDIP